MESSPLDIELIRRRNWLRFFETAWGGLAG